MKKAVLLVTLFLSTFAFAEEKLKMNFVNEDIAKIIEHYSKASGQKFIVDSTVRGKISLLNQNDLSMEEAFNQISEGLALNGFAIIKNGDTMTVRNARSAQRDGIETSTSLPSAKPQRMVTWIISLKFVSAEKIQQQLRLLTSSYGEMSAFENNNQLIISDFTSNLQRIGEIIKNVDVPQNPAVSKIVAESKKERDERHKNMKAKMSKDEASTPPSEKQEKN
jgi:type II secretory pathway component GspD/PulD (secretin)